MLQPVKEEAEKQREGVQGAERGLSAGPATSASVTSRPPSRVPPQTLVLCLLAAQLLKLWHSTPFFPFPTFSLTTPPPLNLEDIQRLLV